jgi:penicillin amidase
MQQDDRSLRGSELVPDLVSLLKQESDPRILAAVRVLEDWDGGCSPASTAASIFNVFFTTWCELVARQRFAGEAVGLVASGIAGLAGRLLKADPWDWFHGDDRARRVREAFHQALTLLAERLGSDLREWTWGRLHQMQFKHVLSGRGQLGELLDPRGAGVRGDMVTVCNTGSGPQWAATSGAGYRLIADLSVQPPVLQAIDAQSQSGHPGSPHYCDQFPTWLAGGYHEIPLDKASAQRSAVTRFILEARTDHA